MIYYRKIIINIRNLFKKFILNYTIMEESQSLESPSAVEHSLYDKWTFWAHLPHDTDWSLKSYTKILELTTIEEVISLYKTVPALMIKNCMLYLMRSGVNPTWEDPRNNKGGCFSFKVLNKNVPLVWKDLSYAMTGETLSNDSKFQEKVTGITISPKKSFCIFTPKTAPPVAPPKLAISGTT